jgi:bla regulator protein BlaR1
MRLPGYISAREMTMPMLAARLAQIVRRPVIDRTGLTGMFDLDLGYATEYPAAGPGPPNGLPPPSLDAPSIFTAVREQLRLRLESTTSPLDVLVVDHAEKPTEN